MLYVCYKSSTQVHFRDLFLKYHRYAYSRPMDYLLDNRKLAQLIPYLYPCKLLSWLKGIMNKLLLVSYRTKSREKRAHLDLMNDTQFTSKIQLPTEEVVLRDMELYSVYKLLKQIPIDQRLPLELFVLDKSSYEEIALQMKIPVQ